MRKRLPSILSLQAFEATGRHLSFTRAATELAVTQGAISQRVAKLESMLGGRLFLREGNALYLTPLGESFLATARATILHLAQATDHAIDHQRDHMLSIGCLAGFANKALIPQLISFRETHPDIGLRLRAFEPYENPLKASPNDRLQNRSSHDYDALIQLGPCSWPNMINYKFADEDVFPVCSPAFAHQHQLQQPRDLKRCAIILNSHPLIGYDYWPLWLDRVGIKNPSFAEEIRCDPLSSALQLCLDGLGIMMGRGSLIRSDLSKGRLIEPFSMRLRTPQSYHLVIHRDRASQPNIERFIQWTLKTF